jgi:DNA topoisomerase-1
MLKLGKKPDDTKYTAEELSSVSLDDVKKMIEAQVPDAFMKKAAKKTATKKAAPKKKTAKRKK